MLNASQRKWRAQGRHDDPFDRTGLHRAGRLHLYQLTFPGGSFDLGSGGLLVEAFAANEQLQTIGARDIIVLLTSAHFELALLLR